VNASVKDRERTALSLQKAMVNCGVKYTYAGEHHADTCLTSRAMQWEMHPKTYYLHLLLLAILNEIIYSFCYDLNNHVPPSNIIFLV
jgi:hypothetical protein